MFDMVISGEALPCDFIDFCVLHIGPVAEDPPFTVFLVMPICEVFAAKKLL